MSNNQNSEKALSADDFVIVSDSFMEPVKKKNYVPKDAWVDDGTLEGRLLNRGGRNGGKEKKEDVKKQRYQLPTANSSLISDSKKRINRYLKTAPQYKIIQDQIDKLQAEYKAYSKANEPELAEKCKSMIMDLSNQKASFTKIFKPETATAEGREKIKERVENSELLKELKLEKQALIRKYNLLNPNSLYKAIRELRQTLDLGAGLLEGDVEVKSIILDDEDDELSIDFESEDKTEIAEAYYALCDHIAVILDTNTDDILKETSNNIFKRLKDTVDMNEVADIKTQIDLVSMKSSSEMKRLKGSDDITDVMFEIFDFQYDEHAPKDLLAAQNVGYVNAIATSKCISLNMLHYKDDAVAYGLLGLSQAINKWFKLQKISDSALSFEGFAHSYISNTIQRGLYELSGGGTLNGSSFATKVHYKEKYFKMWLENNPNLAHLPQDMLVAISDISEDVLPNLVDESTLTSIIGGEDAESSGEIWDNVTSDSDMSKGTGELSQSLAESKMEYKHLVDSMTALFQLFEVKENKKTGLMETTEKKVFDKYDYKLFMLTFGLEGKSGTEGTTRNDFTQAEIAEELSKYYLENGIRKSFSQPAISYRQEQILSKIRDIMDVYPKIKQGFEYIYLYWQQHQDDLNFISNNRENLGINLYQRLEKIEAQEKENHLEKMSDFQIPMADYYIPDAADSNFNLDNF